GTAALAGASFTSPSPPIKTARLSSPSQPLHRLAATARPPARPPAASDRFRFRPPPADEVRTLAVPSRPALRLSCAPVPSIG
uniref:Uncharacterized protein n=1 Tax=Triticum urartu TaxID=4572 RepID=A0A8R7QQE5_TRIUA